LAQKKSYLLRIDPDLFEAVQRWAADELRSANGQLEFIVRQALNDAGRLPQRAERGGGAKRASK